MLVRSKNAAISSTAPIPPSSKKPEATTRPRSGVPQCSCPGEQPALMPRFWKCGLSAWPTSLARMRLPKAATWTGNSQTPNAAICTLYPASSEATGSAIPRLPTSFGGMIYMRVGSQKKSTARPTIFPGPGRRTMRRISRKTETPDITICSRIPTFGFSNSKS